MSDKLQILKTSEEWNNDLEYCNIEILNPSGWNSDDFLDDFYDKKITKEQFEEKLNKSTILTHCKEESTLQKPKDIILYFKEIMRINNQIHYLQMVINEYIVDDIPKSLLLKKLDQTINMLSKFKENFEKEDE